MHKLCLAGAALAFLIDGVYLAVIETQHDAGVLSFRVPFVAGFIAVAGVAAGLASWPRLDRRAPLLLGFSAASLVAMGVIAIFSVGIAILLAAVPVVVAAVLSLSRARQPLGLMQGLGGFVLALVVFVAGLQLTEMPVACPPTGYVAGSGPGLFSGPYHWTCVNGKLTVGPGECNRGGATVDPSGKVIATSGC